MDCSVSSGQIVWICYYMTNEYDESYLVYT